MKKYRILKIFDSYGGEYYSVDQKLMYFIWDYVQTFNTLNEARLCIERLEKDKKKPKNEVVEYHS